ncbi:basic salivary proline-rich protein 3-like [Ahaetulla prasina]|uniref:basic salivary proline-rich protein 3-like n=1 Tax=Ahaetulla prasina TaxID=499056 RepID=UPI00264792B9|nr:basic salivary proline-rich protein 3-like [Ahaetulla prasina]
MRGEGEPLNFRAGQPQPGPRKDPGQPQGEPSRKTPAGQVAPARLVGGRGVFPLGGGKEAGPAAAPSGARSGKRGNCPVGSAGSPRRVRCTAEPPTPPHPVSDLGCPVHRAGPAAGKGERPRVPSAPCPGLAREWRAAALLTGRGRAVPESGRRSFPSSSRLAAGSDSRGREGTAEPWGWEALTRVGKRPSDEEKRLSSRGKAPAGSASKASPGAAPNSATVCDGFPRSISREPPAPSRMHRMPPSPVLKRVPGERDPYSQGAKL